MTKLVLRAIAIMLALVVAFIVFSPKNDSQVAPQPRLLPEATISRAEKQVSEAAKDPDKAKLMQCMGVVTEEGNSKPPSKEECDAVAQRLGERAGETPDEIKKVQDQMTRHQ